MIKYALFIILTNLIFCENLVKDYTLPKMKINIQESNLFSFDYLRYKQSATVEFDILENGSLSNFELLNTQTLNF